MASEIFGWMGLPPPKKSKIEVRRWAGFRPFEQDGVRGGGAETATVFLKWGADAVVVVVPGCGRRRLCAAQTRGSYGTTGDGSDSLAFAAVTTRDSLKQVAFRARGGDEVADARKVRKIKLRAELVLVYVGAEPSIAWCQREKDSDTVP